jgi:hypothetical protein
MHWLQLPGMHSLIISSALWFAGGR